MEQSAIKSKIEKLERVAQTTGPDADNARRLIEKLINKYKIRPEDINEPRKSITYKLHRLKKYGIHLACWMQIPVYIVRGKPDYVRIEANSDEYLMFHELMGEIKHQFNKKEREYKEEAYNKMQVYGSNAVLITKNNLLKSFMKGYMDTNYPYDKMLCKKCKIRLDFIKSIGKFRCPNCSTIYGSSKYRGFSKHEDAFIQGVNTTTKSIKQNRERLTYNN